MGWSSYLGHYLFFIHKILEIECMCLLYTTFHHPPVVLYIAFIHWYLPLRWTPFPGTYKFLYLDIKVYTIFCPLHCSPLSPSHFKSVPTFHPPFPIFFFFLSPFIFFRFSCFLFPPFFSFLFFSSSVFSPPFFLFPCYLFPPLCVSPFFLFSFFTPFSLNPCSRSNPLHHSIQSYFIFYIRY